MAIDRPTATIEGLFLPGADLRDPFKAVETLEFSIDQNGIVGDRYRGNAAIANETTPAYLKEPAPVILNRRTVSVIDAADLDEIGAELGLNPSELLEAGKAGANPRLATESSGIRRDTEDPGWLVRSFLARCMGVHIVLANFQSAGDVTRLSQAARGTDIGPYDPTAPYKTRAFTGATVMLTTPVGSLDLWPGKLVEAAYPRHLPDLATGFVNAASGRSGYAAMVAKSGFMSVGQEVIMVPFGEK